MLSQGVHPKLVSETLGSATVAITLDLYSHATSSMHREAARTLDALLRAPEGVNLGVKSPSIGPDSEYKRVVPRKGLDGAVCTAVHGHAPESGSLPCAVS
jgi:hypothetical protein